MATLTGSPAGLLPVGYCDGEELTISAASDHDSEGSRSSDSEIFPQSRVPSNVTMIVCLGGLLHGDIIECQYTSDINATDELNEVVTNPWMRG